MRFVFAAREEIRSSFARVSREFCAICERARNQRLLGNVVSGFTHSSWELFLSAILYLLGKGLIRRYEFFFSQEAMCLLFRMYLWVNTGDFTFSQWRKTRMRGVLLRSLRVPLARRMTRQMADHPTAEQLGLTGWQYYFNTQTIAGRRNVSKLLTWCSWCALRGPR